MNKNLSIGHPATEAAAVRAEGPGIGTIVKSFNCLIAKSINLLPGSDIPGVPASLIRARFLPCFNNARIDSILAGPECW